MDAIEFNDAKSTKGALVGLRKLGSPGKADASGKADPGGLSLGRRLVVVVNPQSEGQPELEEGDFRRSSPHRSSRGPADRASPGAAVKPGVVQVVDHGVHQKEAVRRLFEAHVLVASLEEQLEEKEALISMQSQLLNKNGVVVDTAQPEQSTKPMQPVHIEVVHEIRSTPPARTAKPARPAKSPASPRPLVQPARGPSHADKRSIAQEKVSQEEAAQSGVVRKGFPKWLMADERSRQAVEKVWNMMLHDWNAKLTLEKNEVVHNLWHCGLDFVMRWGGDPNELLQEQIEALTLKYSKVQKHSQQEIAMLRQHVRRTEVQYKKLQEYSQKLRLASPATADNTPKLMSRPISRQVSRKSLSSTGDLSQMAVLQQQLLPTMRSLAAGGNRASVASVAPMASPSQAAAPSPRARVSQAAAPSPRARVSQASSVGSRAPLQAAPMSPSGRLASPQSPLGFQLDSPDGANSTVGSLLSPVGQAKASGNKDIVEDDTLMVNVALQDLEAMDHEVFEPIKNLDADQQEMVIDMVSDKVRRILALDPSKWTDGRLPFGLRPDNTPADVVKLEAENKHLRGQLIEAQEALQGLRAQMEGARQIKQLSEPAGKGSNLFFKTAVNSTVSMKGLIRSRTSPDAGATASDADAKNENGPEGEDDDEANVLKSKDKELKALREKVAELEARLRKQQEELSKAASQASLAQQQLAQKEKELNEKEKELRERKMSRGEAERSKAGTPDLGATSSTRATTATPTASTRATTANSGGGAKSFWVEIDQSNSQDTAGAVVSTQGGPPPALRVESIDPSGQVAKWNKLNPGETVAEGDLIVEINGVSGDGDALMQAFKEHGLLKMKLLRDPSSAQLKQSGSRTTSRALWKTSNMLHRVLSQVAEGKNMEPTTHQKHVEEALARGNDVAESPRRMRSHSLSSQGTQCGETLDHFENWIDEVLPANGALEEELNQFRQRCKSQEDEIARLVLIIDEMRARMGNMMSGGEATSELALGLLQKAGLKEVVDASASSEAGLRPVFLRLYQDAVQRLQRFALIRQSVKAMNKAILAGQGGGQGSTAHPDLAHLKVTAAAALSGMWYGSEYIFRRMGEYAASHGVDEIARARTTSLAELRGSAPSAEDTDLAPPVSELTGVQGRNLCTPPKTNLERLPGRRSERFPRASGHPLPCGLGASDGLLVKLSSGAGDHARSPRQQQLRRAQLADPEPTPFTCYMASVKEARGDLQGREWVRAISQKLVPGERPPRADALGEGGSGPKVAHRPAGSRGFANGGLHGAKSLPALPRIRGAAPDGEADAAPARRAQEPP